MSAQKSNYRIKILKDGPYLVTGHVPLGEKIIVPRTENEYVYQEGRQLPQADTYSLCRCGQTRSAPFCDGTHVKSNFDGTEKSYRAPFIDRAKRMKGQTIDLLDDGRCAYARFCHSDRGKLGHLVKFSGDPENRAAALKAITECPAGRLVATDKDGTFIEPALEQGIDILQDPEEKVCGPIYVHGGIPIESSDGEVYEVRNRQTLCRCGLSRLMPFCDAKHVSHKFTEIIE